MSEIAINYRKSGFTSSASRVSRAIDSRYSDYSGIKNKLNGISSTSSYLNSAGSYLAKKLSKTEECGNKIERFKNNVVNFVDYASGVDKQVARRISQNANNVYGQVGIKTGLIASCVRFLKNAWDWIKGAASSVGEFFRNIKNEIIELYNNNLKPIVDSIMEFYKKEILPYVRVVMDIVTLILGAVALVGAFAALLIATAAGAWIWALIGIVAGAFLVFDSLLNTIKDVTALVFHLKGDDERCEEIHKISNRDLVFESGGSIAVLIYDIGAVADFVYNFGELAKGVYKGIEKAWKAGDSTMKNLSKLPKVVSKELFGWKKKDNSKPFFAKLSSGERAIYPNGKPILKGIPFKNDKQMIDFLNFKRIYSNAKKIYNIAENAYNYDENKFQIVPKQFGTAGGIVNSINNLLENFLVKRYS